MTYILLIGLVVTVFMGLGYLIIRTKIISEYELSWKKCILSGIYIYFISLFLGALATVFLKNINNNDVYELIGNSVLQIFGLFVYAVFFSFFLVFPALVIGLKLLSKTGLTNEQKQSGFAGLSLMLVLTLNALMSNFFSNTDFLLFLAGFSFFGVVIPWFFARKVFREPKES